MSLLKDHLLRRSSARLGAPLAITLGTSLLIQTVTFVSGVVLARGLGPESRGQLAVAMLWPPLLAGLGALGVSDALTYRASKETSQHSDALTSAVVIGIGQSVLLMAVGLVILPVVLAGKPGSVLDASRLYLLVIPLNTLAVLPLAVFQGRFAIGPFNLGRLFVHVAYTALVVALWLLGRLDVFSAVLASLAATFAAFLAIAALARAHHHLIWKPKSWSFTALLGFGSKVHVGNVAGLVAMRLDVLALSLLPSTTALGSYVVATAVASSISLIPSAVSLLAYPTFSRDLPSARAVRLSRILLLGIALTIVIVPLAVVMTPILLPVIFGQPFKSAVIASQVLLVGYAFRGWASILAAVVRGAGRPLTASVGDVLNVLTLGSLLAVLVPFSAGIGAAVAVVGAATIQVVWLLIQSFRSTGLSVNYMFENWMGDVKSFVNRAVSR